MKLNGYSKLQLGEGIGLIKLGSHISKYIDDLQLICVGDQDQQLTDFFESCNQSRNENKSIFGNEVTYKSNVFDLWIEVEEHGMISSVSTGENCQLNGSELIGQSRLNVESLLGAPSYVDADALGASLIYDDIGLTIRLNDLNTVDWVTLAIKHL